MPNRRLGLLWAASVVLLAACQSTPKQSAPVVDASTNKPISSQVGAEPPRLSDAGTYMVKRGDTLVRIALDYGQDWHDLVRWNNLTDPNQIQVGQVLRVTKPGAPPATTRPIAPPQSATPSTASSAAPAATTPQPRAEDGPGERVDWAWPASGKVLSRFQENGNKGLDIGGTPGDPVLAAGDGTVVYSGSGLRGYGQLLIVKHNATYLSAYAHNKVLLVKEGQAVKRGQKIAELGNTDTEVPHLHFEIRRQGKPVDPSDYLPPR